jgi:hypothetical protein
MVATSVVGVLAAANLLLEWRQPVYVMPAAVVVIGTVCALLTILGAFVAARRGLVSPWLAPLYVTLLLLSVLVLFILAIVPAVVVLILVLNRRARRPSAGMKPSRSLLPALLLTLGLVPLFFLFLLGRPVVQCLDHGEEDGAPIWLGLGGGGSGSASISGPGTGADQVTGTATIGSTTYSYVCSGTRLVQFSAG